MRETNLFERCTGEDKSSEVLGKSGGDTCLQSIEPKPEDFVERFFESNPSMKEQLDGVRDMLLSREVVQVIGSAGYGKSMVCSYLKHIAGESATIVGQAEIPDNISEFLADLDKFTRDYSLVIIDDLMYFDSVNIEAIELKGVYLDNKWDVCVVKIVEQLDGTKLLDIVK